MTGTLQALQSWLSPTTRVVVMVSHRRRGPDSLAPATFPHTLHKLIFVMPMLVRADRLADAANS